MRFRFLSRLTVAAAVGFVVSGGIAGGVSAYATQPSNDVAFYSNSTYCAHVKTITNNDTPERAQINVVSNTTCLVTTLKNVPSGYLGSDVALKKIGGAVCRSVGTTYTTGSASGHTSNAYWESSACGTNIQLQAAGTGHAYNGSGYTSKASSAPFQIYP